MVGQMELPQPCLCGHPRPRLVLLARRPRSVDLVRGPVGGLLSVGRLSACLPAAGSPAAGGLAPVSSPGSPLCTWGPRVQQRPGCGRGRPVPCGRDGLGEVAGLCLLSQQVLTSFGGSAGLDSRARETL